MLKQNGENDARTEEMLKQNYENDMKSEKKMEQIMRSLEELQYAQMRFGKASTVVDKDHYEVMNVPPVVKKSHRKMQSVVPNMRPP